MVTPVEDSGAHGRTVAALHDAGLLYATDVIRHLGAAACRPSAVALLTDIKGVGKTGANAIVTWLRELGWPSAEVESDATRVAPAAPAELPLVEDEHPDVTAWRDTLRRRFPASDIEQDFDLAPPIFEAYATGRIPAIRIDLRPSLEERRLYLGASSLGQRCARKAWAQWRGLDQPFEGRLLRLFRSGDIYEDRMRAELAAIGFELAGEQAGFEAFGGRVRGHTDDFARLEDLPWALWEAKSANDRKFSGLQKLVRERVRHPLRKWSLKYWHQVQTYLAAFDLRVCLFEVSNKNTDDIITLLVPRDEDAVAEAGAKAREILNAVGPPSRGYGRPATPDCTRYCDHVEWCWYGADLPRLCGACVNWRDGLCSRTGEVATTVCEHFDSVPHGDNETTDEWEAL